MKVIKIILLIAVLILPVYSYALPVSSDSCPCDTLDINETNGAEILAEICPGGELAPDAALIFTQEELSVSLSDPERGYGVGFFGKVNSPACELRQGFGGVVAGISFEELEACRVSIIEACGLNTRSIPTLSEWGLIAMAGVLGLAGLLVIKRKRTTA